MREPRIDIIRGWAIFVIVINHLSLAFTYYGLEGFPVPTPTNFGYSSAAEVFVMMSGYMVGMVYLARPDPSRKVLARATKLYVYNLLLFLAILPASYLMSEAEAGYWHIIIPSGNELQLLLSFATLAYAPKLLDVLQLYILLMLATPLAIAAYRKSPSILVSISVGMYLSVQILERVNRLPNVGAHMTFNFFSWQLAFFLPMMLGARKIHVRLFVKFEEKPYLIIVLSSLFLMTGFSQIFQLEHYLPSYWVAKSRNYLGPLRLCHAILTVGLYFAVLAVARPFLNRLPFRVLACVGRNSLNCFSLSVLTTYALALAWDRLDGGYATYLGSIGLSLSLTVLYAKLCDRRSRSFAVFTQRSAA